jgi:DNA-binding transcriptional ArsR family regulator/uncharacterized protein YndB with AHSA1/START domain
MTMAAGPGDVWKALADPTRRELLELLRDRPRTTGELCEAFPSVTRFAVMKHLTTLEHAGLVAVRREGRVRWNHINAVPLRQAYERFLRPYADADAQTLLRLADAVAETEHTMSTTTSDVALTTMDNQLDITIPAPREKVFDALTAGMGAWWPHRFVADSQVHCEPEVGGRFYEDYGNGNGALYATVTGVRRPEELMLSGPMGMTGPVASVMVFTLEERGNETVVRLSHKGVGDISEETKTNYDQGWRDVFEALRAHLAV